MQISSDDEPEHGLVHYANPGNWPERVRVVVLSFLSFVLCNCDRINISVAIMPMADHYGWSLTEMGVVQSAFFWGYLLTQIPGGYIADRYGGKHVLSFGVIAWSLMTILTPAAATSNFTLLLVARAFLGLGEGVAMPAMNNMMSRWVPSQERSRSLSAVYSGMYGGSVVGLWMCPCLIAQFGWPSVFYFFGGIGFIWWVFWQYFVSASPDKSKTISQRELKYLQEVRGAQKRPVGLDGVPWGRIFKEPATWAIIVAHFCVTWGYFVLLSWLPTYFTKALGFPFEQSAFLSILPWLAMFISANIGGGIADNLIAKNWSITRVRKLMQTIGFLGPAIFLGLVAVTKQPLMAVGFMTAALAFGSFSQSGVYSNHQDIGPKYTGLLLGISNTGAAIPGILGNYTTGLILQQTGSWTLVFGLAIFFYLFGCVFYNIFGTGEKVFD